MAYTIGACGFSATGSSAVTDYLKEFDENVVLDDFEFTIAYMPDGLQDLRYHLHEGGMRDISCKVALKRFEALYSGYACREYQKLSGGKFKDLSKAYLDSLIQLSWIAQPSPVLSPMKCRAIRICRKYNILKMIHRIEEKKGHEIEIYPLEKHSVSIYPEDFDGKARKYIMSVLDAMGRQKDKNVVLDQPFSGNNPQLAFPFFENPRAIITERDPRDYYLFIKKFLFGKGRRQLPGDNVKDFVTFYRKERENMPYKKDDPRILNIYFEDMIYRYDETTKKICDFCGLRHEDRKRKLFAPELSINNTQVFKRYPEYAEDIKYIEEQLGEYLYPFEEFGEQETGGQMFLGRSPLNKRK